MTNNSYPPKSTTNDDEAVNLLKKRSLWFSGETYLTADQLREYANSRTDKYEYFAYIVHDKDEGKQVHTHILAKAYNQTTGQTLQNDFAKCMFKDENDRDVNTFMQATSNVESADKYLEHDPSLGEKTEGKHRYDRSEVIELIGSHDVVERAVSYFKSRNGEPKKRNDPTFEILEKLLQGVSKWQLAREYGRDFIMNLSKYEYLLNSLNGYEILEAQGIEADNKDELINEYAVTKATALQQAKDEAYEVRKNTEEYLEALERNTKRKIANYFNKNLAQATAQGHPLDQHTQRLRDEIFDELAKQGTQHN